jgi:hypothetical protein
MKKLKVTAPRIHQPYQERHIDAVRVYEADASFKNGRSSRGAEHSTGRDEMYPCVPLGHIGRAIRRREPS